MKKILHTLKIASVLAFIIGAFAFSEKKDPPYKNPKLPIEERVSDLLGRMTLEEKFWQMFMIPGDLKIGKDKLKHGIFGFQISSKGLMITQPSRLWTMVLREPQLIWLGKLTNFKSTF